MLRNGDEMTMAVAGQNGLALGKSLAFQVGCGPSQTHWGWFSAVHLPHLYGGATYLTSLPLIAHNSTCKDIHSQ
ncbi:Hypothetical predicted protein [Marmota monax]|uniref:Uncharacterized protein n=1 Tax=Marmota monax TaxID=9995 RepID=A0A5E4CM58_MARMO|nr:hypothetical protein GHT09_004303 [Marmota monax]VTJ82031.1 Hypothetical predicted protein [Marmota monax]